MTFEIAQGQGDDEHLLVVAHVAVVVVPGCQANVETRVLLDHLRMDGPDFLQPPVGRCQERVQDGQAQILFVAGHETSGHLATLGYL